MLKYVLLLVASIVAGGVLAFLFLRPGREEVQAVPFPSPAPHPRETPPAPVFIPTTPSPEAEATPRTEPPPQTVAIPVDPPVINEVIPLGGGPGTPVTITGANLSSATLTLGTVESQEVV